VHITVNTILFSVTVGHVQHAFFLKTKIKQIGADIKIGTGGDDNLGFFNYGLNHVISNLNSIIIPLLIFPYIKVTL
jgi:hypothetical protein